MEKFIEFRMFSSFCYDSILFLVWRDGYSRWMIPAFVNCTNHSAFSKNFELGDMLKQFFCFQSEKLSADLKNTMEKLEESRQLLKTNENGELWKFNYSLSFLHIPPHINIYLNPFFFLCVCVGGEWVSVCDISWKRLTAIFNANVTDRSLKL